MMIHPKDILIADYTYNLPEERIAKYPLTKRDEAKLLIYNSADNSIEESQYKNLAQYLREDTLLVFNNTKVINARLIFHKKSGAKIEFFCLEPESQYKDISSAIASKGEVQWLCYIGGLAKIKNRNEALVCAIDNTDIIIHAKVGEPAGDAYRVHFSWQPPGLSFAEVLSYGGCIPLPPYLKRNAEEKDAETYQTIFATEEGSVAAPTSALHFTPELMQSLFRKNIRHSYLTLHVGAGTFKPVKSKSIATHEMHPEFIEVSQTLLQQLIAQISENKPIMAVGTTSVRTLESLYWIGVRILNKELFSFEEIVVSQWYPYNETQQIFGTTEALQALSALMHTKEMETIITRTQIIIAPSYQFKIIHGLITNFHQPDSTLLLLVAALTGEHWKKIYEYALHHQFRFLSYGDGCLLLDKKWKFIK